MAQPGFIRDLKIETNLDVKVKRKVKKKRPRGEFEVHSCINIIFWEAFYFGTGSQLKFDHKPLGLCLRVWDDVQSREELEKKEKSQKNEKNKKSQQKEENWADEEKEE